MSEGITLEQAQAQLDSLMAAQQTGTLKASFNGRTVEFRTAKDLQDSITYWSRIIAEKKRAAAGLSRHGFKKASFRRGV